MLRGSLKIPSKPSYTVQAKTKASVLVSYPDPSPGRHYFAIIPYSVFRILLFRIPYSAIPYSVFSRLPYIGDVLQFLEVALINLTSLGIPSHRYSTLQSIDGGETSLLLRSRSNNKIQKSS